MLMIYTCSELARHHVSRQRDREREHATRERRRTRSVEPRDDWTLELDGARR